jgi:5-methylcytosine-specific restriction endonuclease McrA
MGRAWSTWTNEHCAGFGDFPPCDLVRSPFQETDAGQLSNLAARLPCSRRMTPVVRICAEPGCNALITPGQSRCPAHQRRDTPQGRARRSRKTTRAGYFTKHWRQVRRLARIRDGGRCRNCGATGDLTGHLDPAWQGQHAHAPVEAVVTLCRRCHGAVDGARAYRGAS